MKTLLSFSLPLLAAALAFSQDAGQVTPRFSTETAGVSLLSPQQKVAIAQQNAFFESSDHQEIVLVYCTSYKPKPQGCEILKGKNLDDLMDTVQTMKGEHSHMLTRQTDLEKKCGSKCR